MRIVKILFLLLTICQVATATDAALGKAMESLTSHQRTLLYQYGTLCNFADSAEATRFWQQHQQEIPQVNQQQAGLLATELLSNTELVYTVKTPSRLQALRGVFTVSRLLLGLAALIAAYAVLQLLGKYLPGVVRKLVGYFSPAFRWLFSPRMLSWELFCIGLAGVYFGTKIPDLIIRNIVIHVGLFFVWGQLTALLTRKDFAKHYLREVIIAFKHNDKPFLGFLHVSVPAIFTSLVIYWVMRVCPDSWYAYEVIVPFMIGVFTLPPLRKMELIFSRLLLPFTHPTITVSDRRKATYIVISLAVWAGMLVLPAVPLPSLLVLTVFLTGTLLLISVEEFTHCGGKNYVWVQLVTLASFCVTVLVGSQLGVLLFSWIGLGGMLVYVMIKYWEIPVLLGWTWKNRKPWGALGMALLIWGIAALIRSHPEWFAMFLA